jgi:hypothetical protein
VSWIGHLGGLIGGIAAGWIFRSSKRGLNVARKEPAVKGSGSTTRAGAAQGTVAVPVSKDNPRADLHKELGDLGL